MESLRDLIEIQYLYFDSAETTYKKTLNTGFINPSKIESISFDIVDLQHARAVRYSVVMGNQTVYGLSSVLDAFFHLEIARLKSLPSRSCNGT